VGTSRAVAARIDGWCFGTESERPSELTLDWAGRWRTIHCLRVGSDNGKMDLYDIRKTGRREMTIRVQSIEGPAMRKPRVRLREFLLLTTLASLVTAAFAIRARTANLESAQEHDFHAHRERLSVKWWEDHIQNAKKYLEVTPPISEDWAAGCDLRLIRSVKDVGDIPTEGKDLIIVADVYGVLYFRMFDGHGKIVVDWAEGLQADNLEKQFVSLWPPHELTGIEKARVITAVTSILGASRATVQASVRSMQAMRTEAIAKADHHEQIARRP
jgi:hypothetical protein